ncbi:SRPBCC family protein [Dactylosporangium sp. NPDC051541]|uniref:SRPBCC family protein n=1 Tax=Dactylosporangium sp. NPDC051541 TaxID=3363977 RepID=UPI0037935281
MQLENTFTVPVPVDQAWAVLLDIERIAPCMPGATLTSVDGDDFTGTVKVKLGPVSLTFRGSGKFVERDEAAHRVVISANGADSRGGGTARATVTATLIAEGDETRVNVSTDLDITGKAAQFGRGLIGDVSGRLIGQFADCLAGKLAAGSSAPSSPSSSPPPSSSPSSAPSVSASAGSSTPSLALDESRAGEPIAPVQPEAEAIDLLAVSGVGAAVRRVVPYVVTAAAGFAVVFGIVWWIRRR